MTADGYLFCKPVWRLHRSATDWLEWEPRQLRRRQNAAVPNGRLGSPLPTR